MAFSVVQHLSSTATHHNAQVDTPLEKGANRFKTAKKPRGRHDSYMQLVFIVIGGYHNNGFH